MLMMDICKRPPISEQNIIIFPLHRPTYIFSVLHFESYQVNDLLSKTDVEIISKEIKYDIGDLIFRKDKKVRKLMKYYILITVLLFVLGLSLQETSEKAMFGAIFGIGLITIGFFYGTLGFFYFLIKIVQLRKEFRRGINAVLIRHLPKFQEKGIFLSLPENNSLLWLEMALDFDVRIKAKPEKYPSQVHYTIMNNNINIISLPKQEISQNFQTSPNHNFTLKVKKNNMTEVNLDQKESSRFFDINLNSSERGREQSVLINLE